MIESFSTTSSPSSSTSTPNPIILTSAADVDIPSLILNFIREKRKDSQTTHEAVIQVKKGILPYCQSIYAEWKQIVPKHAEDVKSKRLLDDIKLLEKIIKDDSRSGPELLKVLMKIWSDISWTKSDWRPLILEGLDLLKQDPSFDPYCDIQPLWDQPYYGYEYAQINFVKHFWPFENESNTMDFFNKFLSPDKWCIQNDSWLHIAELCSESLSSNIPALQAFVTCFVKVAAIISDRKRERQIKENDEDHYFFRFLSIFKSNYQKSVSPQKWENLWYLFLLRIMDNHRLKPETKEALLKDYIEIVVSPDLFNKVERGQELFFLLQEAHSGRSRYPYALTISSPMDALVKEFASTDSTERCKDYMTKFTNAHPHCSGAQLISILQIFLSKVDDLPVCNATHQLGYNFISKIDSRSYSPLIPDDLYERAQFKRCPLTYLCIATLAFYWSHSCSKKVNKQMKDFWSTIDYQSLWQYPETAVLFLRMMNCWMESKCTYTAKDKWCHRFVEFAMTGFSYFTKALLTTPDLQTSIQFFKFISYTPSKSMHAVLNSSLLFSKASEMLLSHLNDSPKEIIQLLDEVWVNPLWEIGTAEERKVFVDMYVDLCTKVLEGLDKENDKIHIKKVKGLISEIYSMKLRM
ncbi:MAG: hypothetical protein WC222_08870 [Parachlamydiales bacterium]|jgi:hypothetical protein